MTPETTAALAALGGAGISGLLGYAAARVQARSQDESTDRELTLGLVAEWRRRSDAAAEDAASAKVEAAEAKALAQKANDDLAAERVKRQEQDRVIAGLRRVLHAWSVWGQQLHDNWTRLRQDEAAPPLPVVDDSDN